MKRLFIIAILIVGGVLIFTRDKAPDMDKTNETVSEEIEATEEVVNEVMEEVINEEPEKLIEEEAEEIVEEEVAVVEPEKEVEVKEVKKEIEPKITTTVLKPVVVAVPVVEKRVMPVVVSDVKVYLYDFNIDISKKEISAGKINFEVMNNGKFSHDFAIANFKNFGKVRPGETQNFSAFLNAGKIKIYSDRNQDSEYGMVETVEIQ